MALLLLVLSALWCLVWFLHSLHYYEDDAYIHLEFARSVARGNGFSFNGQVVYGDTSPLWVYLLVAFHSLIPSWIVAGKVLSLAGVLLACTGVYFYARKLVSNAVFASAMVLLFVVNPYFSYWSFSGMEAIAATGLAFWGIILVSECDLTWPRFFSACLIAGLAPITRPEMLFFTGLLGLVLMQRWLRMSGTAASKALVFAAGLILASGPSIAWGIYAIHSFGRMIPNTNAAKRAALFESVPLRLATVYTLGYPVVTVGLAVGLIYLAVRILRGHKLRLLESAKHLPVAGWIFVAWSLLTSVFYIANHTYVQTRYILITASGLTIVVLAIVILAAPKFFRAAWIVALCAGAIVSCANTWPLISNKVECDRVTAEASLWIRNDLPPDAPVAVYGIGQIAFISEHPIVDTGGITRPEAIQYSNLAPTEAERWIRSEGASYRIMEDKPEPGAVLVYSRNMPVIGWFLDPRRYRANRKFNIWKLPAAPR
jgi:hypothetical protein